MRIDSNLSIGMVDAVRGKNVRRVDGAPEETDAVALSRRAAEVQTVMDALRTTPEIREEQVVALRAQIDQGEFVVDDRALAAKLFQNRGGSGS